MESKMYTKVGCTPGNELRMTNRRNFLGAAALGALAASQLRSRNANGCTPAHRPEKRPSSSAKQRRSPTRCACRARAACTA